MPLARLESLQEALGVSFNHPALLEQALVHSSYVNENPGLAPVPNERLEFLGDAVLGLVMAQKLYTDFPEATEGELTGRRAALVRRDTLARVARTIHLGDYLYLGKGEESSGGRRKPANLAGALESVIGAYFLDHSLPDARELILRLFDVEILKIARAEIVDYKSQLQKIIQAREQQVPSYVLVEEAGPPHDRRFTIEARFGQTVLGRGRGKSKKEAESDAARDALGHLT